ncbi:hypothetical protein ACN38_g1163 [Penicillium nordicum]|uniref:Uncharacterized protein n=1 Tax=Penicillium nordicum TaxID=229535 RepID=A0A0N0RZX9_9EURO|nr:hypothetical protein ACN38_g1163 [Penicillium nordicum]
MGLKRAIDQYANADIDVNGKKKQPDMGWGPRRTPRGCKKRPTVILEVGVSETEAKLRRDADLWLDPNRGNAYVVITIKLNRKKALVKIDKWVWDGANGTSVLSQHIEVSENDLDEVKLSGGPLTIPFNLLFLREPEVTRKPIIHEGCVKGRQNSKLAERLTEDASYYFFSRLGLSSNSSLEMAGATKSNPFPESASKWTH